MKIRCHRFKTVCLQVWAASRNCCWRIIRYQKFQMVSSESCTVYRNCILVEITWALWTPLFWKAYPDLWHWICTTIPLTISGTVRQCVGWRKKRKMGLLYSLLLVYGIMGALQNVKQETGVYWIAQARVNCFCACLFVWDIHMSAHIV